jgi:DNA-binding beta-propeller fold protein YncE
MNSSIVKTGSVLVLCFAAVAIVPLLFFSCNQMGTQSLSDNGTSIVSLAASKSVPSRITEITLSVSGDGMETVSKSIDPDQSSLTLEIPAGEARTFSLTMANKTVTFSGSVTEDLTAGEETELSIPLELSGTKPIVPDADYYNGGGRIVQINGMTGAGWIEKDWDDFSGLGYGSPYDFFPYDVDFDDKGRIYIANNSSSGGIIRLDDINDTSPEAIVSGEEIPSLAIDRLNGFLYYFIYDGDLFTYFLKQYNYNTGNEKEYNLSPYELIPESLAIDDEGMVYIVHDYGSGIQKFNPTGEGSLTGNSYTAEEAIDVLYKNGYIYVADIGGELPPKVIKLTTDLDYVDELPGKPDETDPFHGPQRFLAVLSDKIYVIDEEQFEPDEDNRTVAFDDISGTGWTTYQNSSDPFSFFYNGAAD